LGEKTKKESVLLFQMFPCEAHKKMHLDDYFILLENTQKQFFFFLKHKRKGNETI